MNQCKQCGANLPEGAKFCFQCGAPVEVTPTAPAGPQLPLDFIQPALAGGMFLGLLSSLPFINIGNYLCCMWILAGGGIATILLTRQRPAGVKYGDGAFVGVLSGLFGAVVATIVSIPIQIIMTRIFGSQQRALEDAMKNFPELEGPARDMVLRMASPEITVEKIIFIFVTQLLLFSLFAMIGGILTVAIVNKRKGAGINPRPDVPS